MREELGPEVEVETHIEPLQPNDEPGRDARPHGSPRCATR